MVGASPRLAASNLNLDKFQHGNAGSDSDDSDCLDVKNDHDFSRSSFKLFNKANQGRVDYKSFLCHLES